MRVLILCLSMLICACGREQTIPTAEENEQLDDVENLLNLAPEELEEVQDFGIGAQDNEAQDRP